VRIVSIDRQLYRLTIVNYRAMLLQADL